MGEPTIKMIWGLAKSKELSISDEDLHLLVQAHTGKTSIRALNSRERSTVIGVLQKMKDDAAETTRKEKMSHGNVATVNQRKKVYKLTEELGWDKKARIDGMCRKMFGVGSLEWIDYQQCSKLIEALKKMVARKEMQDEKNECKTDNPGQ